MKKNCLTCKYEPDWGRPVGREFPRQSGKCKKQVELPVLPAVHEVHVKHIIRYSDNSGLPAKCPAWEPKE